MKVPIEDKYRQLYHEYVEEVFDSNFLRMVSRMAFAHNSTSAAHIFPPSFAGSTITAINQRLNKYSLTNPVLVYIFSRCRDYSGCITSRCKRQRNSGDTIPDPDIQMIQ